MKMNQPLFGKKYPTAESFRPIVMMVLKCSGSEESAMSCRANVVAALAVRPKEELDRKNIKAFELARLRLRQERQSVVRMRNAYAHQSPIYARILADTCGLIIKELDKAIDRAHPLPSERGEGFSEEVLELQEWAPEPEAPEAEPIEDFLKDV